MTGLRPELLPSHIGDLNHAMTMSQQADPCNPFQLLGISAMIASGIIVAEASLIAAESLATAVSAHSAGDIATAYNAYVRSTIAGVTAVEEATGYMGPSLSGAAHGLIRSTRNTAKAGARRLSGDIIPTYNGKQLTYHDRIRRQAVDSKKGHGRLSSHNYPYSFDQQILDNGPIGSHTNDIGQLSTSFGMEGHIGNTKGVFEIGVNEQTSTIVHRSFRADR